MGDGGQRTDDGELRTRAVIPSGVPPRGRAVEESAFRPQRRKRIPPLRDCCAIAPVGMTGRMFAVRRSPFAIRRSLFAVRCPLTSDF